MRIAITSDIHYFPQWQKQIKQLASRLASLHPDLLILAGDIGEPIDMFVQGLTAFQDVATQKAALAGNHDVWHRSLSYTSERLWESLLQEGASAYDYLWLDRTNLVIDSLGICGSIAWYDYGGKHPQLNLDDTFYQHMKSRISNDANYIDWPWSDLEFARIVEGQFITRLDELENNPDIHDILVVTHVPLYRECLKPTDSAEQGVLNAYYANIGLGKQVLSRDKVRMVVSGHVHRESCHTITRHGDRNSADGSSPVTVFTTPSDYGSPAAILIDTDTWEGEFITAAGASRA